MSAFKGKSLPVDRNVKKVKTDLKADIVDKASLAFRDGDYDKAIHLFELGRSIWPRLTVWDYNIAVVQHKTHQYTKSLNTYNAVLKADPKHVNSHLNMSNVYYEMGLFEAGAASAAQVLSVSPEDGRAYYNLGRNYDAMGENSKAEDAYKNSIRLSPDLPEPYIWLAKLLGHQKRYVEALAVFQNVPEAIQGHPDILNHIGTFKAFAMGDWQQAAAFYRKAVEAKPDHWGAHVNLGLTRLTLGDFEGWDQYYDRFKIVGGIYYLYDRPAKRWDGVESFKGKKVLVWGDQGIGDTILWGSMLRDIMAEADKVVFECDKRLVKLFRRSFPGLEVYPIDKAPCKGVLKHVYDLHTSILDLGRRYRRDPTTFPSGDYASYLKPDKRLVDKYRARYRDGLASGNPVIGISWASHSPHVGVPKTLDVDSFKPLFDEFPNARFVHLQFGPDINDVLRLKEMLGDRYIIDGEINNYKELDKLAAQIAACDLVVGGSNSNIHFAGALGVPAFLLLSHGAALLWYWQLDGDRTLWYDSVVKYYKKIDDSWESLVRRVVPKVRDLVGELNDRHQLSS